MDNDVILKLAAARLLDAWQESGIRGGEVRVLPTAKFFFRKRKDLPNKFGEAAVKAAVSFAGQSTTISKLDDPKVLAELTGVSGIDAGEALLFAAAVELPDYLIISGDKVALKALQTASGREHVRDPLKGRIIAFEQVVLALIGKGNFAVIRERIVAAERADTVMQVAFGLGLETTQEKATEALEHYIEHLR